MSRRSLIIAAIVLAFAVGAQAAPLTVTNTSDGPAPGPDGSLRRTISDALSGDTIQFALPANSTINLTSGELLISKNLTINGPGAALLRVQRSASAGDFRLFYIAGDFNEFNVTISGLTIANGKEPSGGGCIANRGKLTITNSIVSGNSAGPFGGGIYNISGTLNVTNSTVSGNSAVTFGGGILSSGGTVNVTSSAISGNFADDGGGIYKGSGMLNVTNSTISGNTASVSRGGGILNNSGTVNLTNSTISGNSARGYGGGILNSNDGTVNAKNTIIAKNTGQLSGYPDFGGKLTSQGYNLIGNTSGTSIAGTTTGNQLNVDPMLGSLQDNGGPTFTHALLSGSTAIEGGDSSGSNTDQRGVVRPVDDPIIANATGGDGSDIGAYEVQADLLPGCNNLIVNNNNDSGDGSLRAVLASVCPGSTITFAPNVRGVINLTIGELLINKSLTINGPGANLLRVQRSAAADTPNFRIFKIESGAISAISCLTIANGNTNPGGAGNGGGILNGGTLTLANSVISGNTTSYSQTGGGPGNGGGISNNGTLTLTSSIISDNTASASSAGGILNSFGTLTIINSTISGNSATGGFGGGIWNYAGTLTITNSTVSGNSASDSGFGLGGGGGILNQGGTVAMTNSTISGNTAEFRGGGIVSNTPGTVRARNTIISLNNSPSGPDVYGILTSEGFNLIGNSAGAAITPAHFSDQIGTAGSPVDPLLGPLQNNGGPTRTHALLSGSRAIDKGHSSGSFADQRGFSRPADNPAISNVSGGDGGDIGAFELGGATASLQILSITRFGSGPVVLQVAGFPHGMHRIQASVDSSFGSFIDVATVAADAAGRFQYQNPVAGLSNFYRVAFP